MVLSLTSHLAPIWWESVCDVWWDAWIELWDGVGASIDGTYWAKESLVDEYPDLVDAHVDFGGGDE